MHRAGVRRRGERLRQPFCVLSVLSASPARAWIYPEHRAIAGKAVADLSPAEREALEALWAEARQGHEERLCARPVGRGPGAEARVHRLGRVAGDLR